MLKAIKQAMNFIIHPGSVFRFKTRKYRNLYYNASRILHPLTYFKRCCSIPSNDNNALEINPDLGFCLYDSTQISDLHAEKAIQEIKEIIKSKDIEKIKNESEKKYLLKIVHPKEISRDSEIFRFVTHPRIVNAVGRYLGCFPLLTYISVWYSPNDADQDDGSQKYHLDHEDFRQVKGFLFVEDVDSDSGPFTLIPAKESHEVEKKLNYEMTEDSKRVEDEDLYAIIGGESKKISLEGKKGTLAMVDTSNCFHYGSRKGSRPRLVLTFQYMTPFAFVMPWNWKSKKFMPHLRGSSATQSERKLLGIA